MENLNGHEAGNGGNGDWDYQDQKQNGDSVAYIKRTSLEYPGERGLTSSNNYVIVNYHGEGESSPPAGLGR